MPSKLSRIKHLFLKRMLLSLFAQGILISLTITAIERYTIKSSFSAINDTLIISDQYTTDLLISYIKLGEIYALELQLHNIGDMKKLDSISYEKEIVNNQSTTNFNAKMIYNKNGNYVIRYRNDQFQGVTRLQFQGETVGYIITKKIYPGLIEHPAPREFLASLFTASIAFFLNFVFLFASLKNRIIRNTSQVINAIMSSNSHSKKWDVDIYEYQYLISEINSAKLQNEKLLLQKAFAESAASLVHDMRSPLAVMELTLNQNATPSFDKKLVALRKALQNIKQATDGLLQRYRIETNVEPSEKLIKDVDYNQEHYFIHTYAFIEELVQEKSFEWSTASMAVSIDADNESIKSLFTACPNRIKRVLSNILNNAYDATNGDGSVCISIRCDAGIINISIEDNGIGIPKPLLPSVLSGTSLKHSGKGLGLLTASNYLKELGGSLHIQSEEYLGTKVTISIPKAEYPIWLIQRITVNENDIVICVLNKTDSLHKFQKITMSLFVRAKFYSTVLDAFSSLNLSNKTHNIHFFTDITFSNDDLHDAALNIRLHHVKIYIISDKPYSYQPNDIDEPIRIYIIPSRILEYTIQN